MDIQSVIFDASEALGNNDLDLAGKLMMIADLEISISEPSDFILQVAASLGGVMIDYGSWTEDLEIIKSGTKYISDLVHSDSEENISLSDIYNLANGYAAMRKLGHLEAFENGEISSEYIDEKKTYRKAIELVEKNKGYYRTEKELVARIFTNYGNALDSMGRPVEALVYYDKALALLPEKPETLASKAIALKNIAFLSQGHTHLYILEAKYCFELALVNIPSHNFIDSINGHLAQINEFIKNHKSDVVPEEYKSPEPTSLFHEFLQTFIFNNQLYLTPSTLIGKKKHQFLGDPLFISKMTTGLDDRTKFDKAMTFFNQIKQDYVFSRYLLVQSQYQADHGEIIDKNVDYYYPLDYSVYSSYVEMMKASFRLAVDTLDKISFFIRDYCSINNVQPNSTYFRNIFSSKREPLKLRDEIKDRRNTFLFGLLDMSLDVSDNGHLSFIYERRNALTHRFLSIHTESIRSDNQNDHIPKIMLSDFLNETIQTLQILKAAIFNLVLFIEVEETRLMDENKQIMLNTTLMKIDESFRWKPPNGDN